MAVEYDSNGIPILTNDSLISDVPPYTQLIAGELGASVADAVPVGCVMLWINSNAVPEGWLPLDGSVTDLTSYPKLASLFPGGLPNATNLRPRGSVLASAGNYDTPKLEPNQLAPHCHDISNHSHITDVGRDHQGATTLAGSPHAVHGSFPINSRGSNANRAGQAVTHQSIQYAYDANAAAPQVVDHWGGGQQPVHKDLLVVYIIKAG